MPFHTVGGIVRALIIQGRWSRGAARGESSLAPVRIWQDGQHLILSVSPDIAHGLQGDG